MGRKKFHWWMLVIPVLLAAVILTALFRDALLIRITPKAVLTSSITRVFSQLEERFREDPLLILAKSMDPQGQYTADIQLVTSNNILGAISYDMTVQTDAASHRLYAEGTANTSSKNLDLSLYLDSDFMAASSDDFTQGKFYGITYDTFTADVRSIPLLQFVLTDKMLSRWNDSVQDIQKQMNRSYTFSQMPDLSAKDIQKLLLGVLALPCEVEGRSVLVDHEVLDCQALSYSANGAQVAQWLPDALHATDGTITVTFYLYQNSLVRLCSNYVSVENSIFYDFLLGHNPVSGTLKLQCVQNWAGEYENSLVTVSTIVNKEHYCESWTVQKGAEETAKIAFDWVPSSGDMNLTINGAPESVALNLVETETGFKIETNNPAGLMHMILQTESNSEDSKTAFCSMIVSRGSNFETPTYKNLDQWILDDVFILLQGAGTLLGIDFALS